MIAPWEIRLTGEAKQFALLADHFFRRFFENDLISPNGDIRLSVTNILALLACPGIFYTMYLFPKYVVTSGLPAAAQAQAASEDRFFYVYIAMLLMGVVTILEMDALFPDRRDYLVLSPLPVRMQTLFFAKIASLVAFVALFSISINGLSAFLYPIVSVGPRDTFGFAVRLGMAQAVSVVLACVFVFLFCVAAQGLLLNLLSARLFRRVSLAFQFFGMLLLILALFFYPRVTDLLPRLMASRAAAWLPPAWFFGLYEVLAGQRPEPFLQELGGLALGALLISLLAAAAVYLLSYRRCVGRSLESAEGKPALRLGVIAAAAGWVNRHFLQNPFERACFWFAAQVLSRSKKHQLYVAAYVGVGSALVIQGLVAVLSRSGRGRLSMDTPELLSVPLLLSFFLLSGLRFSFTVPAELKANWIFRLSASSQVAESRGAARKIMLVLAMAPLLLMLAPAYGVLWGWRAALVHGLFGLALALVLIELLLLHFPKIPFTCSYAPGKANLTLTWVLYWFAFLAYAYSMARLEAWMLHDALRILWFFCLYPAALVAIHRYRRSIMEGGLIFEEEAEPVVRTLNLSVFTPRVNMNS